MGRTPGGNDYQPITSEFSTVLTVKPGGTAYRRWICLAKLLLEAEQGNWTSLCRVALRNRSQKFSKSSKSSSDVFSNTAITSVVTMLYTTKKDACRRTERALGQLGRMPCLGKEHRAENSSHPSKISKHLCSNKRQSHGSKWFQERRKPNWASSSVKDLSQCFQNY